jgi:uncharacterized membrane protein
MSFSNYAAQAILNSVFGKTSNFGALGSAPTVYVGLSSTTPNEDGTNITEPSGGSYARVSTAPSDWNSATLADPSVIDNANEILFPQATADWLSAANLTHGVLFDAATGGNYLGSGALNTAKPVTNGDQPKIPAGDLDVTLD